MNRIIVCFVVFAMSAFAALDEARFLNVPILDNAPSVQEVSSPEHIFWKSAASIDGFTEFMRGAQAVAPKWNTSVSFAANATHLYVQFRAITEPGVKPLAKETKHDGRVYFDDCLEMAIALPGAPDGEYYQFSVNSANVVYDAFRVNTAWDSHAESKTVVEDGRWTLTMRIPFSDFGLKEAPKTLMCNVARTTLSPSSEQSVLVRCAPDLFFGKLSKALQLNFGAELASGSSEIVESEDEPIVRARALVLPEEKFADFRLDIHKGGKAIHSKTGQVRFDSKQTDIPLPHLEDGNYWLELTMLQAREYIMPAYYGGGTEANPNLKEGQEPKSFMHIVWPLNVDNSPKLQCEVKFVEEGAKLNAILKPRSVTCSTKATYRFTIYDAEGKKKIRSLGKLKYKDDTQVFEWPVKNRLPERTWLQLHAELVDGGETIVETWVKCSTAPKNVWKDDKDGMPDVSKVPAPWVPVELNKLKAFCWGREYDFAEDSPVPKQIFSQTSSILAKPAAVVSEPAINWKLKWARKLNNSCIRFEYDGKTDSGVNVSAFSEVYFDGTIRTDMRIPANAVFRELYLDIPYKKDVAHFKHFGPGRFGGMFNVGTVGAAESYPIIPNMMMLNDNIGLGWFDGMPFDWPLANAEQAVQILPENEQVTLRVNYIDNAKTYPNDRTFSWGLQALPARPMPEKEVGMRMSYSIRYGDEDRTAWLSNVSYLPHGNIDIEKGAMECKFKLLKYGQEEPLMFVSHGDANICKIGLNKDGYLFGITLEYGGTIWFLASKKPIAPGEWHSAAVNWGDGKISLWLDGEMVEEKQHPNLMRIFPSNIKVGGSNVCVDEFRISSEPRKAFAMDEPTVDATTLLYDNFDRQGYLNGRKATFPQKIAADTECGYILPDTTIVDGIRGKAVGPLERPAPNMVEAYARLGFDTICYHASQYTDEAMAGLYISDEKRFRSSLDAIHKYGMRGIIYVGNGISNYDRNWNTYAEEWLIEPRGMPFIAAIRPNEKSFQACPRSSYIDYFMHRIGHLMDEYKIDGIFMDGRLDAQCDNEKHGCGVTDFSGKRVANRDVWRSWRESWRLYNIVQKRGGYCEQHKSGNWNIPNCFFWNGVWEGEQLMGVKLNGRKRLEVCPLEAMRGEINGIPYGMPSRNTAYAYFPFTSVENCTMSFVHGTTWTMTYRQEEGLVVSPYWLAQDAFGATKQNFLPYWAPKPPALQTPDELVKVSAHVKKGAALIMVANFNEDKPFMAGDVKLDLATLGISNPKMRNAFSGEAVPISADGTFKINIKSFRQDWFVVEQ